MKTVHSLEEMGREATKRKAAGEAFSVTWGKAEIVPIEEHPDYALFCARGMKPSGEYLRPAYRFEP